MCKRIYIFIYMHVCICVRMHVMYVCMHVFVCVCMSFMYLCVYVCMYACMYLRVCMCVELDGQTGRTCYIHLTFGQSIDKSKWPACRTAIDSTIQRASFLFVFLGRHLCQICLNSILVTEPSTHTRVYVKNNTYMMISHT